ncbi:MAG: membrane-bound lytic murein transglycosylase MltF [Desulfosudaceae bacterium]
MVLVLCAAVIAWGIAAWQVYAISALEKIKDRGYLIVLSDNNANAYYLYRGAEMGFEYDLSKAFAEFLGVDLRIKTPGWSRLLDMVNTSQGDLIAASMTVTESRKKRADFSREYLPVQQQVIVHKHNFAVNTVEDLAGRTVHVRQGTSYQQRLEELRADGLDVTIRLHKDLPTEELFQRVAAREIEVTIADSNIAQLNRRYYPDVRIAFPISEKQSLAWAVGRGDTALLAEINRFFEKIKGEGTFGKIYEKYYLGVEFFDYVDIKKFHQRLETRLPAYEKLIKSQASIYGFDWRLIAALIYQESHFDPYAKSHTGVRGIMQLTLPTARELGVDNRLDPRQSIKGGVLYLHKMITRFDEIEDSRTRLMFALASYNIGYGHVRDAQQIAVDMGLPTDKWSSLQKTLPLLQNRRYYKDTRYGYARGTETVTYVERILTYYDILKQKSTDEPAVEMTAGSRTTRIPGENPGPAMVRG